MKSFHSPCGRLAPLLVWLGACGAAVQHLPDPAGFDAREEAVVVPAIAELSSWMTTQTSDPGAALIQSHALLAAGRPSEALSVLLDTPGFDQDPFWAAARVLRVMQLRQQAPDFDARVESWLAQAAASQSPLESIVRARLAESVARDAHVREDAGELFDPGPFGAPPWWRVVGPFSTNAHLDALRSFAPESDPQLADGYITGTGERQTRNSLTGSDATFQMPEVSGVSYAEAFFEVQQATSVTLLLSTQAGATVMLDDRTVLGRSTTAMHDADWRLATVWLSPGVHRVLIRSASPYGQEAVELRVLPDVGPAVRWLQPDGVGLVATGEVLDHSSPDGAGPMEWMNVPELQHDGVAWYVAADLAILSGDASAARLLYMTAQDWEPHPTRVLAQAQLVSMVNEIPDTQTSDLALATLRRGAELWEQGGGLDLALGDQLWGMGQTDEAGRQYERALERAPDDHRAWKSYAQWQESQGWYELAAQSWRQAFNAAPDDCATIDALLRDAASRMERLAPDSMPEEWLACESVRLHLIHHWYMPVGDLQGALQVAQRYLARHPGAVLDVMDLLVALGRRDELTEMLASNEVWGLDYADWLTLDARWSSMDTVAAVAAFEQIVAESPSDTGAIEAWARLSGEPLLATMRVDGLEVIQRYEEADPGYTGSIALVHDYAAYRWHENGSGIEIVHTVRQVLTRDALGSEGEVGLPAGAILLTARTIKQDGRIYVPEMIAGKDSISMPNLEIGDFIEIEYMTTTGESSDEELLITGGRFYFQIQQGPMFQSIIRYEYPEAWAADVQFDLRNFDGARDDQTVDGRRTTTFSVVNAAPVVSEPFTPMPDEWMPSVRFGYGRSWERVAHRYTDRVLSTLTDAPLFDSVLADIVTDDMSLRERTQAIFRFVNQDIASFSMFFSEPAVWTLASGEGDRNALLMALLQRAGCNPQLVFVRTSESDQTENGFLDDLVYDLTAVRVVDGDDEIWMEPDFDEYPFDYLRNVAQGQPALIVAGEGAGSFVTTPVWSDATERQISSFRFELQADGSATVFGSERLTLSASPGFRMAVRSMPDQAEFESALERSLVSAFPGLRLQSVDVLNLDAIDEPIELQYVFSMPNLGRIEDGALVIDSRLSEMDLRSMLTSIPDRTLPLRVSSPFHTSFEATLVAPEGYSFAVDSSEFESEFSSIVVRRSIQNEGATLRVNRTLDMPVVTLPASDYPELVSFLNQIENGARLRIPLQGP
jgi:tetratricopeptide (TPR) repeat protein